MLKKIAPGLFIFLFFSYMAVNAPAAEIANESFSITLPENWEELKLPDQPDTPGKTFMLVNKKLNCAVSISLAPNANEMTAEQIAETTHKQMQQGGMKVGPVENRDGVFTFTTEKKPATGWAFFGANKKEVAICTIWSPKLENAKALFKALKPDDPAIFPKF